MQAFHSALESIDFAMIWATPADTLGTAIPCGPPPARRVAVPLRAGKARPGDNRKGGVFIAPRLGRALGRPTRGSPRSAHHGGIEPCS